MNTSSQITLTIQGMTCKSCAAHVQRALADVAGVESAEVNLAARTAAVRGNAIDLNALLEAIQDAGYTGAQA